MSKNALIVCPLVKSEDCSEVYSLRTYDLTIAVDAGAEWFRGLEVTPDFAVGDFDSTDSKTFTWLEESGTQIKQVSHDKEFSDLELALALCEQQGIRTAIIIGALGGRIDHQLCVLGALQKSTIPQLVLKGKNQTARLLRTEEVLVLNGQDNSGTFSVIALESATVSIQGARWNLDRRQLTPFSSVGLSNEYAAGDVSIRVHFGSALIICNDLLYYDSWNLRES
ncbi:MAG: thiamine diphosphokinase [Coriobacteriia bacterium]|nr:thiamine diphosphokinase [Coriobacteriia bacterium]MCL2870168.1 thiamine diphosphokinase [Coriobacteriia bacterium]